MRPFLQVQEDNPHAALKGARPAFQIITEVSFGSYFGQPAAEFERNSREILAVR